MFTRACTAGHFNLPKPRTEIFKSSFSYKGPTLIHSLMISEIAIHFTLLKINFKNHLNPARDCFRVF